MTEYKITIKIPCKRSLSSTNSCEAFLDQWIEKIEELGLQFGGVLDEQQKIIEGVIDFCDNKKQVIEKKILEIQHWLYEHPYKPILMQLYMYTNNGDFVNPCACALAPRKVCKKGGE